VEASFRPVVELAAVMDEFDRPWFISGGWAIDLFVGRATRDHDDIEFGVFFPDQAAIRRHLADWALYRPDSGQWLPLAADDEVRLPAHQIQARSATRPPFQLDVFLNPRVGDDWLSRRHARLRVPATEVATHSLGAAGEPAGIPFLVPEIQLLYKAKAHRPKDDADFAVALPHLDARRRAWLRMGLEAFHPDDPWLAALADHDRA
jgi:hypothetical protein